MNREPGRREAARRSKRPRCKSPPRRVRRTSTSQRRLPARNPPSRVAGAAPQAERTDRGPRGDRGRIGALIAVAIGESVATAEPAFPPSPWPRPRISRIPSTPLPMFRVRRVLAKQRLAAEPSAPSPAPSAGGGRSASCGKRRRNRFLRSSRRVARQIHALQHPAAR